MTALIAVGPSIRPTITTSRNILAVIEKVEMSAGVKKAQTLLFISLPLYSYICIPQVYNVRAIFIIFALIISI